MAYFIFTQGKRPSFHWELLETIERAEIAQEAYKNYRQLVDRQSDTKLVMVKAGTAAEAGVELALAIEGTAV